MAEHKEIKNVYFIEVGAPREHIYTRAEIARLGTILLATILVLLGYKSKTYIEDIKGIDWEEIKGADLVGISSTTSTAPRAFWLAQKIRKLGIPVVMGGPHSTFLPDESLQYADYVVRGEGEDAIVELIEHLNCNRSLTDVRGLSFRDKESEEIIHNPGRPLLEDLDAAPSPDFNLVHGWNEKGRKINIIPIATSRGCPFGCRFCSVIQMFGRKYRFKSIERVIQEIKEVASRKAHIFFVDDNFAANKERTKELLRRMIAEDIRIEWSAQVRTDCARDPELVDLMVKTGCYTLFIGFESINPKTLELYNKKQKLGDIIECIKIFRKARIYIHGMFVFGGDTDYLQDIINTPKFARKMGLSTVQFLMLTPLPGTPVFDDFVRDGRLIHTLWEYFDAHHAVFHPNLINPYDLHRETLKAMKSFFSFGKFIGDIFQGNLFPAYMTVYARWLLWKASGGSGQYFKMMNEMQIRSGGSNLQGTDF